MVIADMMDIKNILKDFSRLAEAKKEPYVPHQAGIHILCRTIAMVLFFSYRV